ncbi:hypothetical protein HED51_05230 [Ochrobactrum grignonense]|nr:hypothetical protein [Brucella grignonensis]
MIASPRQTLRYVRLQADNEKLDTAFSDAMRPALFLFVSILVGSVIAPDTADEIKVMSESRFGSVIFGSWASNMAFSMIIYCIVPLIGALFLALSRGKR